MAADNVELNLGAGGAKIATEAILNGGVSEKHQLVIMEWGAAGSTTRVTGSTALPVQMYLGSAVASVNNGAVDAQTLRVTLASDSTGQVKLAAGTAGIGKLTANSSGVLIGQVEIAASQSIQLAAGTAGIGKLTANSSGVLIGQVEIAASQSVNVGTVTTLPARAATADAITAKLATDSIQNGLTALTPKFAAISVNSSGTTAVVAAVTSKKIRVLAMSLNCAAAVNVKMRDNAAGTDLTGAWNFAANGGIVLQFCPVGHFETAAGNALSINLSAAQQVSGHVVYVEV